MCVCVRTPGIQKSFNSAPPPHKTYTTPNLVIGTSVQLNNHNINHDNSYLRIHSLLLFCKKYYLNLFKPVNNNIEHTEWFNSLFFHILEFLLNMR